MISHDNITWTATVVSQLFSITEEDHLVSFLPLSHVAAQMVDLHSPMYTGAQVWFAQPDALKGTLGETLKEVRPTVFLGVPRVWEKIQEKNAPSWKICYWCEENHRRLGKVYRTSGQLCSPE